MCALTRVSVLALVCTLLAFLGMTPSSAYPAGCNSPVDTHVQPWAKTINVTSFIPPGTNKPLPDDVDKPAPPEFPQTQYQLGGTATYWNCPNGTARNKIKVKAFELCATLMDRYPSELLVSFVYRGHTDDDLLGAYHSDTVGVPMRAVDDRGEFNCVRYAIPDADERWQWMEDTPRWALGGIVNLQVLNNPAFHFKAGTDNWKNLTPGVDPEVP